MQQRFIDLQD